MVQTVCQKGVGDEIALCHAKIQPFCCTGSRFCENYINIWFKLYCTSFLLFYMYIFILHKGMTV